MYDELVKRLRYAASYDPRIVIEDCKEAADVRPVVRGKWKLGGYSQISDATEKWYDRFLSGGFFYCSACKGRSSIKSNFCPNCGADMREES